jgi:hypothetical protein
MGYGVTGAYYVYAVFLVFAIVGMLLSMAAGWLVSDSAVSGALSGALVSLPGVLFIGWILLVLGECRECLNRAGLAPKA